MADAPFGARSKCCFYCSRAEAQVGGFGRSSNLTLARRSNCLHTRHTAGIIVESVSGLATKKIPSRPASRRPSPPTNLHMLANGWQDAPLENHLVRVRTRNRAKMALGWLAGA
jgi:hypothetical protein